MLTAVLQHIITVHAVCVADNGATWTEAKNMTTQCQRPGPKPGSFAGNTPGNGHGVQLSTGRLVVPMYGGTPAGASICYSDDHGQSWKAAPFSADTGANADEIEVAELNPAADAAASVSENGPFRPRLGIKLIILPRHAPDKHLKRKESTQKRERHVSAGCGCGCGAGALYDDSQ